MTPQQFEPTQAATDETECPKCGERQPPRTLCRACAVDMPRYREAQRTVNAAPPLPRVAVRPMYVDEPRPLRRRLLLAAAIGAVAAYTALKRAPGKVPAQVAEVGAPVEAVEIYTTPSCPVCTEAKAYMRRQKIPFTEYDVENDTVRLKEFYERGGHGVPYILVGSKSMHGFNADAFERLRADAG